MSIEVEQSLLDVSFEVHRDIFLAHKDFVHLAQDRIRFVSAKEIAACTETLGGCYQRSVAYFYLKKSEGTGSHKVLDWLEEIGPTTPSEKLAKLKRAVATQKEDEFEEYFFDWLREQNFDFGQFEGRRWLTSLLILINTDYFEDLKLRTGIDFTDMVPYIIEHEIFEAWLSVKFGCGAALDQETRHCLALRREFAAAQQNGHLEKLFDMEMYAAEIYHSTREEYLQDYLDYSYASAKAQRRHKIK